MSKSPITRAFFCGVGGLGTLKTAQIFAEASLASGLDVVSSEVHGMSQRGGSVHSSVLIGGARSPLIADGDADIFVGLEPLEALRYRAKISSSTTVVLNTERIVPVTVTMGGPAYPAIVAIEAALRASSGRLIALNATRIADEAGNDKAANVVLLGVLFGLGVAPFTEAALFEVLHTSVPARFLAVNHQAFELGRQAGARELATSQQGNHS